MKVKQLFMMMVLAVSSYGVMSAQETFQVKLLSGSPTTYTTADVHKFTFEGTKMQVIMRDATQDAFTLTNLDQVQFSGGTYTSQVVFSIITGSSSIVSGATVIFNDISYTSNEYGIVNLSNVSDGRYSYSVSAIGYSTINGYIDVVDNEAELTVTLTSTTAIDNIEGIALAIYPNPTRDEITIKTDHNITQIKVINLSGQTLIADAQRNGNTLSLSALSSGIYYLVVNTEQGTAIEKVIKQ